MSIFTALTAGRDETGARFHDRVHLNAADRDDARRQVGETLGDGERIVYVGPGNYKLRLPGPGCMGTWLPPSRG